MTSNEDVFIFYSILIERNENKQLPSHIQYIVFLTFPPTYSSNNLWNFALSKMYRHEFFSQSAQDVCITFPRRCTKQLWGSFYITTCEVAEYFKISLRKESERDCKNKPFSNSGSSSLFFTHALGRIKLVYGIIPMVRDTHENLRWNYVPWWTY